MEYAWVSPTINKRNMDDQELVDFTNGAPTCSALSNLFSEVTANLVCSFSFAHLALSAEHTGRQARGSRKVWFISRSCAPLECLIPFTVSYRIYNAYFIKAKKKGGLLVRKHSRKKQSTITWRKTQSIACKRPRSADATETCGDLSRKILLSQQRKVLEHLRPGCEREPLSDKNSVALSPNNKTQNSLGQLELTYTLWLTKISSRRLPSSVIQLRLLTLGIDLNLTFVSQEHSRKVLGQRVLEYVWLFKAP